MKPIPVEIKVPKGWRLVRSGYLRWGDLYYTMVGNRIVWKETPITMVSTYGCVLRSTTYKTKRQRRKLARKGNRK